jgi:hypothetical protein
MRLVPSLPRRAWIALAGDLLSAIGSDTDRRRLDGAGQKRRRPLCGRRSESGAKVPALAVPERA